MKLLRVVLLFCHGILVNGGPLQGEEQHREESSPPEMTPAAAVIIPLAAAAAAAASTKTTTKIRSTTESTVDFNPHLRPWRVTRYTTVTVTSYEPRPTFASYPGAVVQKVVSSVTIEERYTFIQENSSSSTGVTSWAVTVPETWVISRPTAAAAKPLPAGTSARDLPCGGGGGSQDDDGQSCVPSSSQGDPLCQASGLRTSCMGQCVRHEEENEWWCFVMHQRDYPQLAMGRACWGGGGDQRFRQLNVPCLEGDLALGCSACGGLDYSYAPLKWEGPEASNDDIVRES
ncbi:hypothetical protein QBC37DRAFT_383549 [Rhypophila decipiens]|uniref:Uncharacterized protein n=1 Tax=Rhypophila decipiens TaxID=261697 RepID=A0AAN6YGW5_9PEZI|nr:hypothetical protein QBC37DRAFT_383549 [Rhypophila decipiens]